MPCQCTVDKERGLKMKQRNDAIFLSLTVIRL